MSRTAAQAWHDLLDGDAALAAASSDALLGELDRANLVFGGRPLCTVLRPRFLSPEEYRRLSGQLGGLMRAFSAAFARAVADPSALAQFRLQDWERTLVAEDKSGIAPSPTSRMDTFVVPGTGAMAITEYNGETPAGAFYNDALGNAFADLPVARAFSRDWIMRPLAARHGVLRALLDSWEAWQGTRALPRIAILDWDDVATQSEFVLCRDFFRARGLVCDIGDPRECEYRDGTLWLHGTPVDLVYKRVLIHELVEREGMESPVVRAVRDRAVCFVNGFRSKILHKKASLAVLSDERNAAWFDEAATSAIANHVPWTRLVEERHTVSPDGEPIDLLTWCGDQRANLVLKPNDDYGGAGIVLGWTVDAAAWGVALRHALTTPYIVQRKVSIPRDAYPSFVDGAIVYADRQVDTAPFLVHGQYVEGVLSRLSTAELLNVTAGGGSQTPSFLVERR